MKMLRYSLLAVFLCTFSLSESVVENATTNNQGMMNIAVVNFKKCVDSSKLGKEEQSHFEALRKQMENSLEEKEKVLNEISSKLGDADYLDSLSPETETELKRKFRALSQEFQQIQAQYYQTLSQANMKILQILQEAVDAASKIYAEQNHIDLIINEESAFFYSSKFDISNEIVSIMDKTYEKEVDETKEKDSV